MSGLRGLAAASLVPVLALALGGCGGAIKGSRTTTIESDPPGATVKADGVEIGETPLTIQPDEIFPPRFVGFEYRAAGTLALSRPGCEPHRMQVDDAVLAAPIRVQLQCEATPAHTRVPRQDTETGARRTVQDRVPLDSAARLREIEQLREQGLISAAERDELRRRVLDSLVP